MPDDTQTDALVAEPPEDTSLPQAEPPANEPSLCIQDMACIFDRSWYEREYPDVAAAGIDAATHYREIGFREMRAPNRFFNPHTYRAANPDLAAYEGDLFLHFIFYGVHEGRRIG
ncbi:hypothetical protein [Neokomagataea tanensis]|nr:hypothetical protein [Neokomagataea tanensis]